MTIGTGTISSSIIILLLAGCTWNPWAPSGTKLEPKAREVLVTRADPPNGCQFKGSVDGFGEIEWSAFGGRLDAGTADARLIRVKNRAAELDANYIQVFGMGEYPSSGWAYRCPY